MNSKHLMKKIVFVLVLFGSLTGSAQSMDKLLSKAFGCGADANGVYTLDNTKDAFITESDAVSYLRDHKGYVVLKSSSKTCSRFGYEEQVFDKIFFLDGKDGYAKYNHCNSTGAFYYTMEKHAGFFLGHEVIKTLLSEKCQISGVRWSGTTVNGLLDGEGIGVIGFNNGWCAIKCAFQCGIPISKPEIIYAFPSKYNFASLFPYPANFFKQWVRKNLLVISYDETTDKTLRWALSENLKVFFEESVRKFMEPEYKKALTLNGLKNMDYNAKIEFIEKFEINKEYSSYFRVTNYLYGQLDESIRGVRGFVANYDNKLNDSLGWISKAKEIIYVYNLAKDYYYVVPPQGSKSLRRNIGMGQYGYTGPYDTAMVRRCIDDLNSVKDKIHDQKSPFHDFYNAIYPDIQAADYWINYELKDALYYDFLEGRARCLEAQAESEREFRSKMCDKCKINDKKTTAPEGYIPKDDHWLWGHPARSKEAGEIVFQNEDRFKWWYIYKNDGTIIEVHGGDGYYGYYYGEYKNVKEMWDDLLAKCKERYCR